MTSSLFVACGVLGVLASGVFCLMPAIRQAEQLPREDDTPITACQGCLDSATLSG
jgi:hypothetical protein